MAEKNLNPNIESTLAHGTETTADPVAVDSHEKSFTIKTDGLVKGNDTPNEVVGTTPTETHANTPTIKDVKEICKQDSGSGSGCVCRAKVDPNDDDIIIYNEGFQVDNNGDATVGRDLYVEDEIVIDTLQKIVDVNGDPFIPSSSGHLNQALIHKTTGEDWGYTDAVATELGGGATSVSLKFWVGTQAQYDSISTKDANTFYIVKA